MGGLELGDVVLLGVRDGAVDVLAQQFRIAFMADHDGARLVGTRPVRDP